MGNSCSPGCRWWCLLWRLLCCPFSRLMSWMEPGTWLGQFLRDFLSTLIIFLTNVWYFTIFEIIGIDDRTDLSLNMLGKSIKSTPLLMKGVLRKCLICHMKFHS